MAGLRRLGIYVLPDGTELVAVSDGRGAICSTPWRTGNSTPKPRRPTRCMLRAICAVKGNPPRGAEWDIVQQAFGPGRIHGGHIV